MHLGSLESTQNARVARGVTIATVLPVTETLQSALLEWFKRLPFAKVITQNAIRCLRMCPRENQAEPGRR